MKNYPVERKHQRYPVNKYIKIKNNKIFDALLVNISYGGAFISFTEPEVLDKEIEIEIPVKDGDNISLRGNIIWKRGIEKSILPDFPPGIGIMFIEMNYSKFSLIEKTVIRKNAG